MMLLIACSHTSDRVILLPDPQGRRTGVMVASQPPQAIPSNPSPSNPVIQVPILVSEPYQVARVSGSSVTIGQTSAEEVAQQHKAILQITPEQPQKFILYFIQGTLELTPESIVQLPIILVVARQRKGGEMVVIGHTDRQGSIESNDQLSLERAEKIRQHVVAQGFPKQRIETVGRGEREPLIPTEDEVAEPRNRRVEVLVR